MSESLDRHGASQQDFAEREHASQSLRQFAPSLVPELLQTREYARAVWTLQQVPDLDAELDALQKRQEILSDSGHSFTFLIAETALQVAPGDNDAKALPHQWNQLAELGSRYNVEIGLLPEPLTADDAALVLHPFTLWEAADGVVTATADVPDGTLDSSGGLRVEEYSAIWERMWNVSVRGDGALRTIRGLKA